MIFSKTLRKYSNTFTVDNKMIFFVLDFANFNNSVVNQKLVVKTCLFGTDMMEYTWSCIGTIFPENRLEGAQLRTGEIEDTLVLIPDHTRSQIKKRPFVADVRTSGFIF